MRFSIDNSDWESILEGSTGIPVSAEEIIDGVKHFASLKDIKVILTENDKPVWLLKYDKTEDKFIKHQLDNS